MILIIILFTIFPVIILRILENYKHLRNMYVRL